MGTPPPRSSSTLAWSMVDAGDVVARLGEAGAGDEADVAGADDGDLHGGGLPRSGARSKLPRGAPHAPSFLRRDSLAASPGARLSAAARRP